MALSFADERVLCNIKPVISSPQEYFDVLVAASEAGRLPARGASGPNKKGDLCRYLTEDGRQCGIGLLYSPEDAGKLEGCQIGVVGDFPNLFDRILPAWLSRADARAVQRAHDNLAIDGWNHDRWVIALRTVPVFGGVATKG